MTISRCRSRSRAIAASPRHGVLSVAIFVLVAQLFLTTAHIHVDEEGWVEFPLTQISPSGPAAHIHAHHHGSAPEESAADVPDGHHDSKRPDCQICQSVPVVSASLAMAPVELPRPPCEPAIGQMASADRVAITEPFSRPRPRAPPPLA